MASTEGLVPITRRFLASYYDKYPFASLPDDVSRLSSEIRSITSDLLKDSPPRSQGVVPFLFLFFLSQLIMATFSLLLDWYLDEEEIVLLKEAEGEPPHKIDENMWKNREHMEEILFLLVKSRCPPAVSLPRLLLLLPYEFANTVHDILVVFVT